MRRRSHLVWDDDDSAGATTTGVLTKLKELNLCMTQVTDDGCAALASALSGGALPVLMMLKLRETCASAVAMLRLLALPGLMVM